MSVFSFHARNIHQLTWKQTVHYAIIKYASNSSCKPQKNLETTGSCKKSITLEKLHMRSLTFKLADL
jgi:hypothetical protein